MTDWGVMIFTCEGRRREKKHTHTGYTHRILVSVTITNNDETAYREEVRALGVWCQETTSQSTSTKQRR